MSITQLPTHGIVTGQVVDDAKAGRAWELRRHMTREERILWKALRTNRLGGLHFRRQQVIDGFIVDFYCHAAALVVEVYGPVHVEQAGYDSERDQILSARGLHVLRVTDQAVQQDLPAVLSLIAALAANRMANGKPLGSPPTAEADPPSL